MISIKELKRLADQCHKLGIKKIKDESFEMELGEKPLSAYQIRKLTKQNETAPGDLKPKYSDEDMMFWSAQGIPEENANG